MTTLFMLDGFEHGRATAGGAGVPDSVTGGASIVTTVPRTGARHLRLAPSASTAQYAYTVASTTVVMSFYVRFATLPTADVQLAHVVSTVNMYLWFTNASDLFGVSVTTANIVTGGPTIVANTWYRIDLEFDTTTNTFSVKCKVDGGTEFSQTGASTSANITAARLGNTSAQTFEAFYDDLLLSVTAGDYPIGDHKIESLIPSSDGTHNITTSGDMDSFTTTLFSNSTTNGYTFIAHRPLQVANTANQVIRQGLNSATTYMEFGLENVSDSALPVLGARSYGTHVMSSATGTPTAEARLLLSDNTEVLTTGSVSVIDATEDPGTTVLVRKRMTIAPSGGWDGTKVNGLKARVGFNAINADVNFIDFMVEVALASGANAAVTPTTVAGVASTFGPTTAASAAHTTTTVASISTVETPTTQIHVYITPTTVVGTATVSTPTVSAIQNVSITTTTVIGTVATWAPAVVGNSNAPPDTVVALSTIPIPLIPVIPNTVIGTSSVQTPTLATQTVLTAGDVVGTGAVPVPTVSAGGAVNVTTETVIGIASIPTPLVTAAAGITAGNAAGIGTVSTPTVQSIVSVTAGDVGRVASTFVPTVAGTANVTSGDVVGTATVSTPTISAGGNVSVQPSTVIGTASVSTPTMTAGAGLVLDTVARTTAVLVPTFKLDSLLVPQTVARTSTIPTPFVFTILPEPAVIYEAVAEHHMYYTVVDVYDTETDDRVQEGVR